jgi:hypothetical protein
MSDEKKDKNSLHPETNFLPPLKMFLAFFDKESGQKKKQEGSDEKKVEKLIEKLSEQEEGTSKKQERRE